MILQKSGKHCYVSVYQIIPEDVPKVIYKFRKHDRKSVGYLWLLGHSQVDCGLGDHFATTVAHLSPKCALSVVFQFSPFRFLFPLPKESILRNRIMHKALGESIV